MNPMPLTACEGGSAYPARTEPALEQTTTIENRDEERARSKKRKGRYPLDRSLTMNQARAEERSSTSFVRIGALLLTAVAISANFTNYGPLIPVLQSTLHINSSEAGLFSTLLYGGIACSYLPGGMLADRFGARRVLMGSLLLVGLGGCLLPLSASLPWMVMCRLCIGLGAGAAIVAGSQSAARLGHFAALGQVLFGGAMQAGASLG